MAAAALALLEDIERGHQVTITSPMVIFETIFTLQTHYRVGREQIRALLTPIINLDSLELDDKPTYLHALDIYVDVNVSFADAYNAAFMMARGSSEMYTWDRGINRIDGIRQVEPNPPQTADE
jgi:predicted nucleic acid-binding protein